MARLSTVLSVVVVALLMSAAPAAAHTKLSASDPREGATIAGPLDELTLTFSRPVELAGSGVEILDETGAPVAADSDVDREVVTVDPSRPLSAGTYGVKWAVRSGDAHPIRDTFAFTVTAGRGATRSADRNDAVVTGGRQPDPAPGLDRALAADPVAGIRRVDQALRAVFYAVALGAVGVLVFLLGVWEGSRREVRRLTRLTSRLAASAAVIVVVQVLVRSARTAGGWSTALDVLPATLTGSYLVGMSLRLIGAVVLAAGLGRLRRALCRQAPSIAGGAVDLPVRPVDVVPAPTPSLGRRVRSTPVVGALLLIASFALVGHAATAGPRVVSLAAVLAHVTAAAVWGGGLLALIVVLWSRHRAGTRYRAGLLTARFSVVAAGGVALAAMAGVALAVVRLDAVSALWTTSYGLALLAKIAVVSVVGGMGAYNHFVVVPALRSDPEHRVVHHLRWLGLAEVGLLLVVAGLTSVLVGLAG